VPSTGATAEERPYQLAEVLSTDPLKCFLVGSGEFVMPAADQVYLANTKTEKDNTSLLMSSDATLLANTEERFIKDEVPFATPPSAVTAAPRAAPPPAAAATARAHSCAMIGLTRCGHGMCNTCADLHVHGAHRHVGQPVQELASPLRREGHDCCAERSPFDQGT
jgi:hypothetical protein